MNSQLTEGTIQPEKTLILTVDLGLTDASQVIGIIFQTVG
jgi:hypothetical protein